MTRHMSSIRMLHASGGYPRRNLRLAGLVSSLLFTLCASGKFLRGTTDSVALRWRCRPSSARADSAAMDDASLEATRFALPPGMPPSPFRGAPATLLSLSHIGSSGKGCCTGSGPGSTESQTAVMEVPASAATWLALLPRSIQNKIPNTWSQMLSRWQVVLYPRACVCCPPREPAVISAGHDAGHMAAVTQSSFWPVWLRK